MSALLCLPDQLDTAVLEQLASARAENLVARRCSDLAEILGAAAAALASLAIIDADLPGLDVTAVTRLREMGVAVAVVAGKRPVNEVRALGEVEVLSANPQEIIAKLKSAPAPSQPVAPAAPQPQGNGKIVAVWGPAGSHGRSVIARDLAAIGGEVLLIDADTQAPSLSQLAGLAESSAIVALARQIEHGKSVTEVFEKALQQPGWGGNFLAGLNTGSRWRELPRPVLDRMWEPLRTCAPYCVVDLAGGWEKSSGQLDRYAAANSIVEAADVVLHVAMATPVGLRRLLEHLDTVVVSGAQQAILLNRYVPGALGPDLAAQLRTVFAGVSLPIYLIPEERKLARAELAGQAAPKSKYRKELQLVWQKVCAMVAPA
ncbi:MAG: hypothetical protein Q4E03_02935 [Trueperella sp.]|nr:hypothetical protein [Trueperella sp.]